MIEHQERPDVENLCGSLIDDFQIMMELALPAFKHPSFRAEKEWRLLRFRAIGHSPKSDPVIDFRLRGDMPVPYLKLEPSNGDLLPITSVRIGPSDRMREHVAFSVSCILEKYGYMGIPLFHSQIPFRPT
jgi:hypothetical protein